jgi:hypothetical protein
MAGKRVGGFHLAGDNKILRDRRSGYAGKG